MVDANPTSPSHPKTFREIERRFLVERTLLPDGFFDYPSQRVGQGYISGFPVTVRLRKMEGEGKFLTVKRGNLSNREEREISIDDSQFDVLWPITEGWRLEKVRYSVPLESHLAVVDIFEGRHEGLIIAEVEFDSAESAQGFLAPDWFGLEVTEDPAYSNARLAAPIAAF